MIRKHSNQDSLVYKALIPLIKTAQVTPQQPDLTSLQPQFAKYVGFASKNLQQGDAPYSVGASLCQEMLEHIAKIAGAKEKVQLTNAPWFGHISNLIDRYLGMAIQGSGKGNDPQAVDKYNQGVERIKQLWGW